MIVNNNKTKIEPFGEMVDSAYNEFRQGGLLNNIDSYGQQDNDEVSELSTDNTQGSDQEICESR